LRMGSLGEEDGSSNKMFLHRVVDETRIGQKSAEIFESYKSTALVVAFTSAVNSPLVQSVFSTSVVKSVDAFACKQLDHALNASARVVAVVGNCQTKFSHAWKDPVGESLSTIESLVGEDATKNDVPLTPAVATPGFRMKKISKKALRIALARVQHATFRSKEAVSSFVTVNLLEYATMHFGKTLKSVRVRAEERLVPLLEVIKAKVEPFAERTYIKVKPVVQPYLEKMLPLVERTMEALTPYVVFISSLIKSLFATPETSQDPRVADEDKMPESSESAAATSDDDTLGADLGEAPPKPDPNAARK